MLRISISAFAAAFTLGAFSFPPFAAAEDDYDKCPCFDAAKIVQSCKALPARSFVQHTRANDSFILSCGPDKGLPNFVQFGILWAPYKRYPGVYVVEPPGAAERCSSPETGGPRGFRTTYVSQHKNCLKHLRAAAKTLSITLQQRP